MYNKYFVKLKCLKFYDEVYHHPNNLACFGYNGSGFWIQDECNIKDLSYSILGKNRQYEVPPNISYIEGHHYLAG